MATKILRLMTTCAGSIVKISHMNPQVVLQTTRWQCTLPSDLQSRNMIIQTEETPNPSSLKFFPGCDVFTSIVDGSGLDFTPGDFHNSPLAKRLFQINGVVGVYLGNDFITVRKSNSFNWNVIQTHIHTTIMDFFAEGLPVVLDDNPLLNAKIDENDSEVVMRIKEIIKTRIRPSIQQDGGDIFFEAFNETTGIVDVRLAGSCTGCPSSTITLKYSVENMLRHYIPEVREIHQIDDEEEQIIQRKLSFVPGAT